MTDTGIRNDSEVHQFVEGTIGEAQSCTSADDRANQYMQQANARLADEGVPHVPWQWDTSGDASLEGAFDHSQWLMLLGPAAFDPAQYEGGDGAAHADVLNTIYHESRHAEQTFRVARTHAGLGQTAAQIAAALQIPEPIAQAAVANPINQCDTAEGEAESWDDQVYGSGAAAHDEAEGDPQHHYQEYRGLSDESDAWATGDAVTSEYQHQGGQ